MLALAEKADAAEEHTKKGTLGKSKRSGRKQLKKKMVAESMRAAPIDLDVGGVRYRTSLSTLQSVPESMLGAMFGGRFELARQADGSIFIDRDGSLFGHVLNWLRDRCDAKPLQRRPLRSVCRQIPPLPESERRQLRAEAMFYQLHELLAALEDDVELRARAKPDLDRMELWRYYATSPHHRNFRGLRLSGIDLRHFDLQRADFTGSDLSGARLDNCLLANANMHGCDLTRASLRGADLRNANLSNVKFTDSVLLNANFTGANLTNSNLAAASFKRRSMEPGAAKLNGE